MTSASQKAQRGRNIALAISLLALVVLFYAMTIVQFGRGGGG